MSWYAFGGERFNPLPNPRAGVRSSVQAILDLFDTTDPAWPNIAAVLREFDGAGIELDETSAVMAVKLGKQRWAAARPESDSADTQATLTSGSGSIVYYIRRGDLIKIGTTTNPRGRFTDLLPDEILAIEPGTRVEEALRHRQFTHLRSRAEYFLDAPELRDHIAHLRTMHGEPDPSWPTMARRQPLWHLPQALLADAMTAPQAAAELGIKENTIRVWAHRGRMPLAGRDERGRCLYYREHMIALRDSADRRLVTRFA